jgi:hypothetical protein
MGIHGGCYVTAPLPGTGKGPSHPDGWLGGHMTAHQDGSVHSNTCYLMPLCSWHNSKSNDEKPFTVPQHDILELGGYMTGELAVTFCLRLPTNDRFAVLYSSDTGWAYKNFAQKEDVAAFLTKFKNEPSTEYYLLERHFEEQSLRCIDSLTL